MQAQIICQNENIYRFWQLPAEANFAVSRPLNSELICHANELTLFDNQFVPDLGRREFVQGWNEADRQFLCRVIYTSQQMIGVALDGLPANESNFSRKLNGDLFERFIQLWLRAMGLDCSSAVVRVPVNLEGVHQCDMSFQQDVVLRDDAGIKAIGSVKTSSKDRIGKIFIDKMLFSALTGQAIPHIAIFLNDVQRGRRVNRTYNVSSTFLPGHFKAFTVKLNPLDGVYYCDLRPNMRADPFLSARISTIDRLFCDEIWEFLSRPPAVAEIQEDEGLA